MKEKLFLLLWDFFRQEDQKSPKVKLRENIRKLLLLSRILLLSRDIVCVFELKIKKFFILLFVDDSSEWACYLSGVQIELFSRVDGIFIPSSFIAWLTKIFTFFNFRLRNKYENKESKRAKLNVCRKNYLSTALIVRVCVCELNSKQGSVSKEAHFLLCRLDVVTTFYNLSIFHVSLRGTARDIEK